MKSLLKSIAVIALMSTAITSCKKEDVNPAKSTSVNNAIPNKRAVMGPTIDAVSNILYRGGSIIPPHSMQVSTTFGTVTGNFWGNTLYAHFATNSAGPWTNGVLPSTFSNPNATYYSNIAAGWVIYTSSPGTNSSTWGSASSVYTLTWM